MRQNMDHRLGGPDALIEVVAIFGKTGKIDHSKIGAARRPVTLRPSTVKKWSGLADVVETGPHELAEDVGVLVLIGKFDVGAVRPRRRDDVVTAELERFVLLVLLDREVIGSARADARVRFGSENDPLRMILHDVAVLHGLVVETGKIDFVGEFVANRITPLVEGRRGRSRGVFVVGEAGETARFFPAIRLVAGREFRCRCST